MEFEKDKLYVDDREDEKIFKILKKLEIDYNKKRLLVGDFQFNNYIFERKSVADFYGSVTGEGRLFEQVENMKLNFENCFVIVSGDWKKLIFSQRFYNPNVVRGAMASLVTKRNIQIITVPSDEWLIKLIVKICEKSTEPYTGFIKRIGTNKEDVYLGMLCCISGLGANKAKKVLEKYKIKDLYNVSEKELTEIDGIGKKLAIKIKEYFS